MAVLATALVAGSLGGAADAVPVNVIYGTDRADHIYGTPGPDVIYAKSGSDQLYDIGDGDVVWASSGQDVVNLSPGTVVTGVRLELNVGNDRVVGRAQDSYINGGSGNDVFFVDGCRNELKGESGRDTYTNNDECAPGEGSRINMGDGDDRATVMYLSEALLGNGNDILTTKFPGNVHAGSGNDFVDFRPHGGDANLNLGSGTDRVSLQHTSDSTIFGSSGADRIHGIGYDNVINSGSSADRIELHGQSSNNALDGGADRPDHALISRAATGTTCTRIERITDLGSNPRPC